MMVRGRVVVRGMSYEAEDEEGREVNTLMLEFLEDETKNVPKGKKKLRKADIMEAHKTWSVYVRPWGKNFFLK